MLRFILYAFAIVILSQQADAEQPSRKEDQTHAKTLAVEPPRNTAKPQQPAKGCPGTEYPHLSCDAVTAQATVQQARSADQQTGLMERDVWSGFLILLVALAAAIYARRAALANERTLRPWLSVKSIETAEAHQTTVGEVVHNNSIGFMLLIANTGHSPAINCRGVFVVKAVPLGESSVITDGEISDYGVHPPSDVRTLGPRFATDAETVAFRERRVKLVVYVRVSYSSPNAPKDKYVTKHCTEVVHMGGTIDRGGRRTEALQYISVAEHNEMS